jgi:hypothetical protein
VSVRAKEKDLAKMRLVQWVSAKGKAGDFGAWFASKRLLQLKPKSLTCSRV